MYHLSLVHRRIQPVSRQLKIVKMLLISCFLILGACSCIGGGNFAPGGNSGLAHRDAEINMIAFLRTQGQMRLDAFQQWIALMRQYNGAAALYEQEFTGDQRAWQTASTANVYQSILQRLNQHMQSIKAATLETEASNLGQQLTRQVSAWSQQHTFHDRYNNTTYHLAYEYGVNGIGGIAHDELSNAQTLADYQQAVEDATTALIDFQAYKANTTDKTPWDQAHLSDLQLLQRYNIFKQKVIVVSLGEQVMRVYNKGHLVKSFQVTTGRPEKPSLPGAWWVENKQSPTIFKSDQPRGSAYWYPDTPINYALLYHSGGYFIHDSWWRNDYGFGTQFPHMDSSGDSFSFDGSHGCINMAKSDAAWLYNYVGMSTRVIVY